MDKDEKQELVSNIARMKELGWKGSDNPTIQEIADDMPDSVEIHRHNGYWGVSVSYIYQPPLRDHAAALTISCNRESLLVAIASMWVSYKEGLLRGEEPVKNPESFKEKVRDILEYHGRMNRSPRRYEDEYESELERDLGDEGILEQINLIHEASAKESK